MTSDTHLEATAELGLRRLLVPDVLRGVAIVAMLVAHAAPFLPRSPDVVRFVVGNINDVASPLFALVMGVSAQIVWSRSSSVWVTVAQQWLRGVALIVLGLWMENWGSWVAVVLCHLGLLLLVGAPMLLLSTKVLAVLAGAVVVISAPLSAWARTQFFETSTWPWIAQQLALWSAQGYSYRLLNLLPFFLFGAVLLRHGMKRDAWLWGMLAIAPAAYLARPVAERLLDWRSVSGDYADTLHDIGLVFVTYVAIVLLATVRHVQWRRAIDAVFVPIRACGQVALSIYLLHVGLIAVWANAWGRPTENAPVGWLVTVPLVIVIGWTWWRYVGTGPVEWLLGWATGRPKRLRSPSGQ